MIRLLKLLFYFVVLVVILVTADRIRDFFSVSEEFVYGLKSRPAQPVSYLPERESRRLPADPRTVAYYSQNDPFSIGEILQTAGVPLYRCQDPKEANGTRILFLDLDLDHPRILDEETVDFLYRYVENGGVIIGSGILSYPRGALKKLFGYRGYRPSKRHHRMILESSSDYLTYLNRPEERAYRLTGLPGGINTNEILPGTAETIARYEDGTAAVTRNRYGKGAAIALGISLYDLRYRNLVGRDAEANRRYINGFEPLSDFIVLFLKGVYRDSFSDGFFLSTAPGTNRATVVTTHDVDYAESIRNMGNFSRIEKSREAGATYNIWVKYLKDDKDRPFFTPENLSEIRRLERAGFEIGSHTVEHTANFSTLPLGDCRESYPSYRPFSISYHKDGGHPTLCGEVKVAKELLLGAGVREVVSFRSGELLYHPRLPEVLERFGYRYSSCFSAEDVLSYFPYRYRYDYYTLRRPSRIWEIPLVYEDEKMPPLFFRVSDALELLEKVAENGAVFTLLIHPDLTWWKLKNFDSAFLEEFYKKLPEGIALMSMKELGEFWDRRDRVVWRYKPGRDSVEVTLWSPVEFRIALVPFGRSVPDAQGEGYEIRDGKILLQIQKGWNRWRIGFSSS